MSTKEEYLNNPEATSIPWLSSPMAESFLENAEIAGDLTKEEIDFCYDFHDHGYITFDSGIDPAELQAVVDDMNTLEGAEYKKYFYDKDEDHPRFFDLWRKSEASRNIARHPKVLEKLQLLYKRKAIPFQTINFKAASEQAAHQDSIHFCTTPYRWVTGVVVLLEEATLDNGPFFLVPGTHKLPIYEANDCGIYNADADPELAYRTYEKFIAAIMESHGLSPKPLTGKAGTVIIFDANIFHGGMPVKKRPSTRLCQVTHYFFEGCERYYCGLFSDTHTGKYADKDLSNKNILGE